jgi:SNF2 family DNA or RNA helicase
VDSLQKRFLLLLSATPIQNDLVELYNVLTLLKPGIFKTEKEFRSLYMVPGKPRVPANGNRLRDLMRDAMIRNTRSLVDVKLPPRHAATIRVDSSPDEQESYRALDALARELHASAQGVHHRLALHHLLEAAGSCPFSAAQAIRRLMEHTAAAPAWHALHDRYAALPAGTKVQALLELLRRNPEEKKIVFVRLHDTLALLDQTLRRQGLPFARFDGQMSGPHKDAAIAAFRDELPVLLSTESGGEGRNLQFCNTLVNFDLPWNPQTIEQRIGRIHRIGQTRDVFIFNLVARDTVEEKVLRILDEKINMFELVVGEIQSILGELADEQDFASLVFAAWAESTQAQRDQAFESLGQKLTEAKEGYEAVKALDDDLFGEEFEAV